VLRIRDVYPGSEFFQSWIPDLHQKIPGCSSRIRILTFTHPRSRGQKSTGSRIRNTGFSPSLLEV
jgi:hypothetical protein